MDLAFAVIGLQDQFDLEDFDNHRQRILVALVETCPTLVAPYVFILLSLAASDHTYLDL